MAELYTYAVARIRAKELSLLDKQDVEQLVSAKSYKEAVQILADKGFDGGGNFSSTEELLLGESAKTWQLMGELMDDMSVFNVFLLEKDFHNLKAAVKAVYSDAPTDGIFTVGGSVDTDLIYTSVKNRDISALPKFMQDAAEKAIDILNRTGDGQLCDVALDRASIEAITKAGKNSGNAMIEKYAEMASAISAIKIALRGSRLKKSAEFLDSAIAPTSTLNKNTLIASAVSGIDEFLAYLEVTPYSSAVAEIKKSNSDFEKWCDNLMMDFIKEQKSNPFTIAPIAAYILARENEIKVVRIILSAKENGLPDSFVRERLRDMYV